MDYLLKKIVIAPNDEGNLKAKVHTLKSNKDGWLMTKNKKNPKNFIEDLPFTPKDMIKLEKMIVRALKKAEHKHNEEKK